MVGIVLDTNILNSGSKDFTQVQFVSKLEDITREIESNDFYSEVIILLPQIVIDELYEHQLASYYEVVTALRGLKLPDVELTIKKDYEKFLSLRFNESISKLNAGGVRCEILPYPPETTLSSIIQRAIKKRPPFEGIGKQSDKGFKDVILWEALLHYKKNNALHNMILVSHDKQLCKEDLAQEFKEKFRDTVYQINDCQQLYEILARLFKKEYHQTFGEQIKQRLLHLINEDLLSDILCGTELDLYDERFRLTRVDLQKISISNIDDTMNQRGRIMFEVLCQIEIGLITRQEENLTDEGACKIEVEYSFDKDSFYLYSLRNNDWGLDIAFDDTCIL